MKEEQEGGLAYLSTKKMSKAVTANWQTKIMKLVHPFPRFAKNVVDSKPDACVVSLNNYSNRLGRPGTEFCLTLLNL